MKSRPFALQPAFHPAWNAFLDALFPPRCAGCFEWSRDVFCARCTLQLRPIDAPLCESCGAPFDPLAYCASICVQCREKTPSFLAARSAFHFEGPLREAVHRFKYREKTALAARLAPFLAQTMARDAALSEFRPQALVPVPLHGARHKKRGFNQSALLARELGASLGVPVAELLKRTRDTPPQVGLNRKQRAANVRGAFVMDAARSDQKGARILLIDDVYTTGATLRECARVLKKAGASEICALTLARLK
ncbi:MAG: ComF family protein [Armatimonadetes bacterium]|nr:ComF family protein [Armatimonadota bacterium]